MCRRIVAAVTLRGRSVHPAMLRAVSLARAGHCEVALVHAVEKRAPVEALHPVEEHSGAICRTYEEIKASYPEITSICLKTGSIWNALLESARGMNADIIVIGSHIHSQLAALVRSSSDRVVHHTDRDVLITRTERYTIERIPDSYQNILIATDLLSNHQKVVERGIEMATDQDAKLSLVHVVEHYPVDRENDDIAPENEDPMLHRKKSKERRLEQIAKENEILDIPREVLISTESACKAISEHAKALGSDLIVIGSRKTTTLNLLLGSSADCIIHNAPCDVLVVHLDS